MNYRIARKVADADARRYRVENFPVCFDKPTKLRYSKSQLRRALKRCLTQEANGKKLKAAKPNKVLKVIKGITFED